jgi:mRNA interferase MazF
VSELDLTKQDDVVPTDCVVNFDNVHTLPREVLRRKVTTLSPARMAQACRTMAAATGC